MTLQKAARRQGLHRARRDEGSARLGPQQNGDNKAGKSLNELKPPGQAGGLFDVFRRRYLLRLLVKKELRVRYQGSIVGLAWSYVQPLVRFAVYYFIVGAVLAGGTEHRGVYIFSGLIMLTFINNALTAGTNSITKNKSLVLKINLPREMFPVASIAVSLYHMFPMYVIMFAGCLISGWRPDALAFGAMALGFAIVVLYGLSVALILGAVNVFLRDVQNLVQVMTTVMRWTVPMIYSFSLISEKMPEWLYQFYVWNPLCSAILLQHRAFWIPVTSDPQVSMAKELPILMWERAFVVLGVGVLVLWFAQWVFSRLEYRFAETL